MPFIYGISMLLGLVIGGILISGVAVSLLLLIVAAAKKWPLLQKVSAISLVLCVITTAGFAYLVFADPNPRRAFREAFQQAVPERVTNLQCRTLWIGDCWVTWLKFETDETEFKKLVSGDLILQSDRNDIVTESAGPNAPDWWQLTSAKTASIYHVRRFPGKYHGGETIVMAFDPATRCAYYYFCGVD